MSNAVRATRRHLVYGILAATLVVGAAHAQPLTPPPDLPGMGAPEIRAQLTALQYTTLSGELAARIDKIATKVGERFKKGDILVVFDCAIQRAQLAHAKAVLFGADKTYAINQRLATLKSIGQLELEVSLAEVQKAKADVAAADATVSKCEIAAPFSGVTVDQKAREFQYTTPGQPLIEILDDTSLEIELIAPSRWLDRLKPGSAFELHIDETNRTFPARVTRLSGRVDPVSQSIKVIGTITSSTEGLVPGMSGRAVFAEPQTR